MPILSVASTRRPLNWVQDSTSDFCLNLLAEIGADSGCLIVIESDASRLLASKALLQEYKDSKVNPLALDIHLVDHHGGPIY